MKRAKPVKFLLYLLIAFLLVRAIKRWLSASSSRSTATGKGDSSWMVRCETCDTFIAERNALLIGQRAFCSRECAEKAIPQLRGSNA